MRAKLGVTEPASVHGSFMPIYPNALNFLPKPSRASRAVPLILNNLEPSRSAITRLKNRWARKGPGGSNPSSSAISKHKEIFCHFRDCLPNNATT